MIIYVITNLLNGKQYVGQTHHTIQKRWKRHCWECTNSNMPITQAIKKYGKENFKIELLEECVSQEDMNDREIYWAKHLNTFSPNGYNLKAGKANGIVSDEVRIKIGEANRGKKRSVETIRRLSVSHFGQKWSEKQILAASKRMSGKRASDLCYQNSVKATQKTYILLGPDKTVYYIENLRKFCKEHKLMYCKMNSVVNKHASHHRGWIGELIYPA